jgi:predicted DNA-binding protein (UPF0251 family)
MAKITIKELESLTAEDAGRILREDGNLAGRISVRKDGVSVSFFYRLGIRVRCNRRRGLAIAVVWWKVYYLPVKHLKMNAAELEYIRAGEGLVDLEGRKTDPAAAKTGLSTLAEVGLLFKVASIPALCGLIGAISSGFFSDYLVRRTNSLSIARKTPDPDHHRRAA